MSKILSVLTSPFWGPKKLEEIQQLSTETLRTAVELNEITKQCQERTEQLFLETKKNQEQQLVDSEKITRQATENNSIIQSLITVINAELTGIKADREDLVDTRKLAETALKAANELAQQGQIAQKHANALFEDSKDNCNKIATLEAIISAREKNLSQSEEQFGEKSTAMLQCMNEHREELGKLQNALSTTLSTAQSALDASNNVRGNTERILDEIRIKQSIQRQESDSLKKQIEDNYNIVQNLLKTINDLMAGIKSDRTDLIEMRKFTEETLNTAHALLTESKENQLQAEGLLAEYAKQKELALLVGKEQKKRAAMALNLCTTSISRIISAGNIEAMEQEYNAILNNINLQMIVKDEALLTTMRTILDTISFFRLQDGDRARLEARHRQRISNLLWDSMQPVAGIFMGPVSLAATAFVAIQAGSMYVGYHRKKNDAVMQLGEELWKLERSALEQLHALRASLFETAWRLSDTYNFVDEWRLTTKQIDWYNEIRAEPEALIRYKKLEQYNADFEAYPYFWYELGVAAQSIYEEADQAKKSAYWGLEWLRTAKEHLERFLKDDAELNLLRQDVIGADARLRHVALIAREQGWVTAIRKDSGYLNAVKKLAVDDPDLLLKAALAYTVAFAKYDEEKSLLTTPCPSEDEKNAFAASAISFLEMLVTRGNNLPISSILLSHMYLLTDRQQDYADLKLQSERRPNEAIKLVGDTGNSIDKYEKLKDTLENIFKKRCLSLRELFNRQYLVVQKIGRPEIFNVLASEQSIQMMGWLKECYEKDKSAFKNDLLLLWEDLKQQINIQLQFNANVLGLPEGKLRYLANQLNNQSNKNIAYMNKNTKLVNSDSNKKDMVLERYIAVSRWLEAIKDIYVTTLTALANSLEEPNENNLIPEDINALLYAQLDSMIYRKQLVGMAANSAVESDSLNFFSSQTLPQDGMIVEAIQCDAGFIDSMRKNNYSFTIRNSPNSPLHDFAEYMEVIYPILLARYQDARFIDERTEEIKKSDSKLSDWCNMMYAGAKKAYHVVTESIKNTKDQTLGHLEYTITLYDNKTVVAFMRAHPDEGTKDAKLLTVQGIDREFLRYCEAKYAADTTRFVEIFKRWLENRKTEIDDILDPKKKEKKIQKIREQLKKLQSESGTRRLLEFAVNQEPRLQNELKNNFLIEMDLTKML